MIMTFEIDPPNMPDCGAHTSQLHNEWCWPELDIILDPDPKCEFCHEQAIYALINCGVLAPMK